MQVQLRLLVCFAVLTCYHFCRAGALPPCGSAFAWMQAGTLSSHLRRTVPTLRHHSARILPSTSRPTRLVVEASCPDSQKKWKGRCGYSHLTSGRRTMHWTVCSMSALGAGDGNGDSTSSGSSDKVQVYCASERERQKLLASILPEDMVILGLSGPADREVGAGSVAAYTGPDAVMPSSPDAPFDAARFHALLAAKQSLLLGQTLLHAPLIPSTQDMLFATLRAPPDGLVCVADIQTKGKGRGSNAWMSPPGCLCFSFAWGLNNAALLPFFQYIVSMALYRAVSTAIGGDAYQRAGLRLKWPNDIYILGSKSGSTTAATKTKIGGVLCQSTVAAGGGAGCKPFRIVAGVGINVLNSEPSCCLRDVLEANGHQEAAAAMSRERLLASFCVHFEELAQVLEAKGFEPLVSEYTSQWMHSGQSVEVQIEDKSKCAHEAVIVGLSSSGYLRARDTASGAELELHPDGNSLDMMQGLIYTKR